MNIWLGLLGAVVLGVVGWLVIDHVLPFPPPHAVVVEPDAEHLLVVAVMPFGDANDSPFGTLPFPESIRQLVESALPNYPGLQPFTRSQLDPLLEEHKLYFEGHIDPSTAIEIGKLTQAKALITGQIMGLFDNIKERERERCETDKETKVKSCETYIQVIRKVSLRLTMQVIDTKTGEILVGESYRPDSEVTVLKGDDLPDPLEMALDALANAAVQIAKKVSDNYTSEFRYGLYKKIKPKWLGIEGVGLSEAFARGDTVYFLMQFYRIKKGDHIEIQWIDADEQIYDTYEVTWEGGDKAVYYPLILEETPPTGLWRVRVLIDGLPVLNDGFTIELET